RASRAEHHPKLHGTVPLSPPAPRPDCRGRVPISAGCLGAKYGENVTHDRELIGCKSADGVTVSGSLHVRSRLTKAAPIRAVTANPDVMIRCTGANRISFRRRGRQTYRP